MNFEIIVRNRLTAIRMCRCTTPDLIGVFEWQPCPALLNSHVVIPTIVAISLMRIVLAARFLTFPS